MSYEIDSRLTIPPDKRTPRDSPSIIRGIELGCAGFLTGVVVFLHGYRASQVGALWRDEAATIGAATMPSLSQLWSSLPHECCAVLPYMVLQIWTGISWLGSGDASLRILAALIELGIFFVFWSNRKTLGYSVPIFSLVLFGLNPTVIRWGISIRGYGLGILFLLLAWGLIWKVVKSPSRDHVALAVLASVLSVQCLYQNAFFLFAICLGASLVCIQRRRWKRTLVVLGIGAISAFSLIPYLGTIRQAQELLVVVQGSYPWSFLFRRFQWAVGLDLQFLLWTWAVCAGVCILISLHFIVSKRNDPEHEDTADLHLFNLTVLVVSTVLFFVFLKSTNLATNPWYFIVLIAVIAMSLDVGLGQTANTSRRRAARLVAAGVLAAVMVPVTWAIVPERFTNLDRIASALERRASHEDLIVLNPYWYGITFQRYYRGQTKWITVPPIEDLKISRFDLVMRRMSSVNPLQPVWDEMEKTLRSGNRVWVIGEVSVPPEGELPHLPPPPPPPPTGGRAGWRIDGYLESWKLQLGYFLNSHLVESQEVRFEGLDETRISPGLEAPIVQVGKGWR